MNHETYISTQQSTSEEKTRFSPSHENPGRPPGSEGPPEKGTQEYFRLKNQEFSKNLRLRQRWEFLDVYRDGVRVSGRHMVLFGLRNKLGHARLGITASKKTGNAVRRAKSRRRIREVFRLLGHDIKSQGWDIVVNVRRSAAEAPWIEVQDDFQRCLKRLISRKAATDSCRQKREF